MASHESYYTSTYPTASPHPPQPFVNPGGPPPPPPPKSHEPSRTSTPSVPPVPPHPNAPQGYGQNYPPNQPSPALPPHPQIPLSPSHQSPGPAHLQNQHQQQYQQQHPQQSQAQQPQAQPQNPAAALPPVDSGWLPDGLKDKNTTDLQPLLNNPELLDALARQHPAYSVALEPLQAAVKTNLALAQHVAQLEAQVKQLRDQTGQLLLNHTSLQTQWRRKQSEMDDALSSWGPRAMYSRLVSSIHEQEALLRAVHESFVDGGGEGHEYYGNETGKATEKEVTEWIKRIREGTTVLEKRREMRQRWDEGRVGGWR